MEQHRSSHGCTVGCAEGAWVWRGNSGEHGSGAVGSRVAPETRAASPWNAVTSATPRTLGSILPTALPSPGSGLGLLPCSSPRGSGR